MCSTNVGLRTNETTHALKYPLCCPAKRRAKEDRNVGLRNKLCQLSSRTRRQTNRSRNRSTTHGREKTSSKTARHYDKLPLRNLCRRCLPTCSRQACPPHSPEKSYKRRVSTQHDSIQFHNGCSVRDKINSVRPLSFIS